MARILYPRLFQPVLSTVTSETVTVDKWVQAPTQPVLRRDRQAPARAASGPTAPFVVTVTAETVTVDKWIQPATQPIVQPRRLTEAVETSDGPSPSPMPAGAEAVTVDKWVQPVTQPVLRRDPQAPARQASGVTVPTRLATTWNANDKSASVTLTNGGLTATTTAATSQGVRSTTSRSSGFVHFELGLSTPTANLAVGIATAAEPLNDAAGLGSLSSGMGFYAVSPTQATYVNAVSLNQGTNASSAADIVSFDINFNTTPPTVWITTSAMRSQGATYNNSATANPSTNTGGQPLTGLDSGPYFVALNDIDTGAIVVANFGATPFNRPVPTGATAWDAAATSAGVAETIQADKWVQPPTQPTRARLSPPLTGAAGPVATTPETVTADRWMQAPTQPIILPRRLTPAIDASDGPTTSPAPVAVAPETLTLDKWFQPATQPVLRIPRRLAADGAAQSFRTIIPETITTDKWVQPATQPVLPRSRQVAIQAGVAQSFRTIIPEAVTLDKWYHPSLSPPPGPRPRQHPPFAYPYGIIIANPVIIPRARAQVHWID